MLLPALSLAVVHIAGDNAGVVPDAAAQNGAAVYFVIVLAYIVLGAGLTGVSAWIGVRSGMELTVVVRRLFGVGGKRIFGLVTLGISIPASALTGGYFAGWLVHSQTGLPHMPAAAVCLAVFTLLAGGCGQELQAVANYSSFFLVPAVVAMLVLAAGEAPLHPWTGIDIDWLLVLALFGYNAGGMRPALTAETAACMTRRGLRAVALTVAAKLFEGAMTMVMAYVVVASGTAGPMALAAAAEKFFGGAGGTAFAAILLCAFTTTMVPAMALNGRLLARFTGLAYRPALALAGAAAYMAVFVGYGALLSVMAVIAVAAAAFICYTAVVVHKKGVNHQ